MRLFCCKFHCVSKSNCLDMQKYQFWKTSHTQNTFFIHIEATENTFLLHKKVIFHAELQTVKKCILHLLVILKIVTFLNHNCDPCHTLFKFSRFSWFIFELGSRDLTLLFTLKTTTNLKSRILLTIFINTRN